MYVNSNAYFLFFVHSVFQLHACLILNYVYVFPIRHCKSGLYQQTVLAVLSVAEIPRPCAPQTHRLKRVHCDAQ